MNIYILSAECPWAGHKRCLDFDAKIVKITTSKEGMEKTITAAEANRRFSRVLREVGEGRSYVVTSHGRPVARISPLRSNQSARSKARRILIDRLKGEAVVKVGRWKRDDLYE